MGQCGLIVRARLKLVSAPAFVAQRTLTYSDTGKFLRDMEIFARMEPQGAIAGGLERGANGFRPELTCMNWLSTDREAIPPKWLDSLSGQYDGKVKVVPFADYANRLSQLQIDRQATELKAGPRPRVVFFLPRNETASMINLLIADPEAGMGADSIPIFPLLTKNFKSPCQRLPNGELVFHIRVYRKASMEGAPDHLKMLKINLEKMVPRILSDGGTFYPPHSPILTSDQWAQHFGPEVLASLRTAKGRYDPSNLLNPGAGIFSPS
jgi:hypothetical protein